MRRGWPATTAPRWWRKLLQDRRQVRATRTGRGKRDHRCPKPRPVARSAARDPAQCSSMRGVVSSAGEPVSGSIQSRRSSEASASASVSSDCPSPSLSDCMSKLASSSVAAVCPARSPRRLQPVSPPSNTSRRPGAPSSAFSPDPSLRRRFAAFRARRQARRTVLLVRASSSLYSCTMAAPVSQETADLHVILPKKLLQQVKLHAANEGVTIQKIVWRALEAALPQVKLTKT